MFSRLCNLGADILVNLIPDRILRWAEARHDAVYNIGDSDCRQSALLNDVRTFHEEGNTL